MFITKALTIFLIFGYAGVHAGSLEETKERHSKECLKQYGIDADSFMERLSDGTLTKDEAIKEITPERYGCLFVCYLNKQLGNKKSIKKHITDSLNGETMYTKAVIDEIKEAVKKCTIKAKEDECKLLECLEPWNNNRITTIIQIRE